MTNNLDAVLDFVALVAKTIWTEGWLHSEYHSCVRSEIFQPLTVRLEPNFEPADARTITPLFRLPW
jgi:hypothetical protein